MKRKRLGNILLSVVVGLLFSMMACSRVEQPQEQTSQTQTQEAQDQKTREKVADATQKIKEKSEELGQKVDTAPVRPPFRRRVPHSYR